MPAQKNTASYLTIALFAACTLALLFAAPNALRLGFPALAVIPAAILFARSRVLYIQFCFSLWFLSPLLRRLVDYRTEFVATSPLLLAPFFACAIGGVVLVRHARLLATKAAVAFTCAFAGIFFGTVYGLSRYPPADVARGLVNWLPPVLFAFFLFAERARLREYRDTVVGTLLWATLLLSLYGVAQFFLLPAWDEAWMRGLQNGAFGQPNPLEVRVFSTMNAPATFASYLMAGLLFAFAALVEGGRNRRLALAAAPVGLLALALTTSRSLWLGLILGVLYLSAALPSRLRLRVVAAVVLTLVAAGFASQAPGINRVVNERLKSFTSGTSDISASARITGHTEALARLATEPLGEGMGSTDADHATDGSDDRLGPHDSTLLESLYALGGPGTLVYAAGLALGLIQIFLAPAGTPTATALRAILFAFFAQALLTSILVGVPGFLTWTCVALALGESSSKSRSPQGKKKEGSLASFALIP
jgi:hypothetical protein